MKYAFWLKCAGVLGGCIAGLISICYFLEKKENPGMGWLVGGAVLMAVLVLIGDWISIYHRKRITGQVMRAANRHKEYEARKIAKKRPA